MNCLFVIFFWVGGSFVFGMWYLLHDSKLYFYGLPGQVIDVAQRRIELDAELECGELDLFKRNPKYYYYTVLNISKLKN